MRAKSLIVVRAGANSLHRSWGLSAKDERVDVAVSYYGSGEYSPKSGEIVHYFKGGKWEGLFDFFDRNPFAFADYTHVWLPDDDIGTSNADIYKLFDICELRKLDLCQPSLSWKSYYSHFITLQNTSFELRYTNFVEVMAPLMKIEVLRRVLPLFKGARFGWGLDYIWPRLMPDPVYKSAIIDAVAMDHLRPVTTGALYSDTLRSPLEEERRLMSAAGLSKDCCSRLVYGGINLKGRRLERGMHLWYELYRGWKGLRSYGALHAQAPASTRKVFKQTKRCSLGTLDLSPLSQGASFRGHEMADTKT